MYCRRPTAKCDSKHISSTLYQTVVGQLFVGGGWWFLLSMVYVIFLKRDVSLLQTTGWAARPGRSASYSVSNSRSFPRGKRPVLEANLTHLVPRLRMNETVGLHVSAFAYAFIGLLLFLLFRTGSSLSPCHLFFYIQQTFILKGIALYNATLWCAYYVLCSLCG